MSDKLPVFPPSKRGLQNDLFGIIEQQNVIGGWWKGQLKRYFDILAPQVLINGVLCYDSFSINSQTCVSPATASTITNTSATQPSFSELKLITDGSMKIDIAYETGLEITGLDFSSITSFQDAINILNASMENASMTYVDVDDGYGTYLSTTYVLTCSIIGTESSLSMPVVASTGTFVGSLFHITAGQLVQGQARGKNDTTELLELFGLNDTSLSEMCTLFNRSEVSDIKLEFRDKNKTFVQEDFDFTYSLITRDLNYVDSIELERTYTFPTSSEPADILTPIFQKNTNIGELIPGSSYGRPVVTFIDSDLIDITSTINPTITTAVGSMLYMSGDLFYDYVETIEVSRTIYVVDTIEYADVVVREVYSQPLVPDYSLQYSSYTGDFYEPYDGTGVFIPGFTTDVYDHYQNDFWLVREDSSFLDGTIGDEGLFVVYGGVYYLSVSGLMATNPNDLAYYISQYIDFGIVEVTQKWYQQFWDGLISLVGGIIGAIVELVVSHPALRSDLQAIAWLFNGQQWETDDEKLKKYGSIVVITILSILYTIYSGDEPTTAYTWLTVAYTVAKAGSDINETSEDIKHQERVDEAKKQEELLLKQLEEAEDMDITGENVFGVKNQFMVLERMIESQKYDVFGVGSAYNIKY